MKKILLLFILLMITGCTGKPKVLVEDSVLKTSIDKIPAATELIEANEDTQLKEELIGNKLIVTATTKNKEYAYEYEVEYDPIKIDGTLEKQDLSQFFTDSEKAKASTYVIDGDIMKVTYEDYSFEVPVVVDMPIVSVDEEIVIDVYTGYDFEDFIHESEGVSHEYSYEDGVLTVNFVKNEWTETISRDVTKIDSSPYPRVYVQYGWWGPDGNWHTNNNNLTLTFYEDGTGTWHNVGISNTVGQYVGGTLTYDSEYTVDDYGKTFHYWFDEDGNIHRIETDGLDEVIYKRVK